MREGRWSGTILDIKTRRNTISESRKVHVIGEGRGRYVAKINAELERQKGTRV